MTLADDSAALEHYSCLVTLKQLSISDLLGLGLNYFMLTDKNSDLSGRKTESIRQWKCAVLGVNVVINCNTFLYKNHKEDRLLGVTGKNNNVHVALSVFSLHPNQEHSIIS